MDIGTLIGIIASAILIIGSILLGGSIMAFVNVPGILIVFGGTVAATLIAERLSIVIGAVGVAMNTVFDKNSSPSDVREELGRLAERARKEDLLALENETIENKFVQKGIRMGVDGISADVILETLQKEMNSIKTRHETGQKVFRFMGATAPAMGMIGTLIGLVQMLQTLSDPSAIGPAMAVALLTTLYGAILAFVIFNPVADKLESRTKIETINMKMAIAGIDAIVRGDNALVFKEKVDTFLAPKQREAA